MKKSRFTLKVVAVVTALALVLAQTPFSFASLATDSTSADVADSVTTAFDEYTEPAEAAVPIEKAATANSDSSDSEVTATAAASESSASSKAEAAEKTAEKPSRFTYEDTDVSVIVKVADANALPTGAQLVVTALDDESDEAKEASAKVEELVAADDRVVTGMKLYDIHFESDGAEIELADGTATVEIMYKKAADLGYDSTLIEPEVALIHLDELADGTVEAEDATTDSELSKAGAIESVEGEVEGFSTFAVVLTAQDLSSFPINFVTGDSELNGTYTVTVKANVIDWGWQHDAEVKYDLTLVNGTGSITVVTKDFNYDSSGKLGSNTFTVSLDTIMKTDELGYKAPDNAGGEVTSAEGLTVELTPVKLQIDEQLVLRDILGNARYYGIVANTWVINNDAETNAAVKVITPGHQSGNDLTAGNDKIQPWVVGALDGDATLNIKGRSAIVYTTEEVAAKVKNMTDGSLDFNYLSKDAVDAYIDAIMATALSNSQAFASKNSLPVDAGSFYDSNSQKYVIDLTGYKDGTYYINVDDIIDVIGNQSDKLIIKKNDNQTIVFNITKSGSVNLNKFTMNGVGSDNTNAYGYDIAKSIVWNIPNATTVNFSGSVTGIVLAPNATVNINSTSAGWLVADKVINPSGEWHDVWQEFEDDWVDAIVSVSKQISGRDWLDTDSFTFNIEAGDNTAGVLTPMPANATLTLTKALQTGSFDKIKFTEPGEYHYTLVEQAPEGSSDLSYDTTVIPVTVSVTRVAGTLLAKVTYGDESGIATFSNTFKTGGTDITVKKNWYDNNNASLMRPTSITVDLLANGEVVGSQVLNALNNWQYTWSNLDDSYTYTVQERDVAGYTGAISWNADHTVATLTNTLNTTKVEGTKVWNVPEGVTAPSTITVQVLQNGEAYGDPVEVTVKDDNMWSVTGLPATDADGNAYTYSAKEVAVPAGYEATGEGTDFVNTYVGASLTLAKTISGELSDATLSDAQKAAITFSVTGPNGYYKQVSYAEFSDGVYTLSTLLPGTYTVVESVDGAQFANYRVTTTGDDQSVVLADGQTARVEITNEYHELTSVSGQKIWDDDSNGAGLRPESVTVELQKLVGSEWTAVDSKIATAPGWAYTFDNLDKYDGTTEIQYRVVETSDSGVYNVTYDGFNVINAYHATTNLSGVKVWEDGSLANESRPDSVTVRLQ